MNKSKVGICGGCRSLVRCRDRLPVLFFLGVLDRFPKLQILRFESDIGLIAYFLHTPDEAFERYSGVLAKRLRMRPT